MKPKVAIVTCREYDPAKVKDAVRRALDLIGGIGAFVKKRTRVLLKPNLLSARLPEEAVDTHPEFVRAAGILAREAGATVAIGDSPGGFFTIKSIDEVYEKSGMRRVAVEENFKLVRFDKALHTKGYPIAEALKDFDLVINLPKFKTHTLSMITGAVKNTYGFMPGLNKVQCHKRAPNIKEFAGIVADIFAITAPALSIMDGIVGMDGDGPAAGRVRDIGLVLASGDAVALDAVMGRIAGLPFSSNDLLKEVTARGLGAGRLDGIKVVGERLDSVVIKDFKLPKTELLYRFPSRYSRHIAKIIRFYPVIDEGLCKKCNICRDICPVQAVVIDESVSRIDERKCIKCFCCHEACPHGAIEVKKNLFAKLIWR